MMGDKGKSIMTHRKHTRGRMIKRVGILGALAGILCFVVGCRHKTPEERVEKISEHIVDEFDLNEAQQVQVDETGKEILSLLKDLKEEREKDKEEVMAQLASPEIDKAKIMAMYEVRKAKFEAKFPMILDKVIALHKSLNEEQRQELTDKAEKFRRWHK
jgi:Spy/CpxP family protein refolding chaperone